MTDTQLQNLKISEILFENADIKNGNTCYLIVDKFTKNLYILVAIKIEMQLLLSLSLLLFAVL